MKRRLAIGVIVAAVIIGLVIGALVTAASETYWSNKVSLSIVDVPLNLAVYSDETCTTQLVSLNCPIYFGEVYRNSYHAMQFYVKNTSTETTGEVGFELSGDMTKQITSTFSPETASIGPLSVDEITWTFTINSDAVNGDYTGTLALTEEDE